MLSYMVSTTSCDKPPIAPMANKNQLQLSLENHLSRNGNARNDEKGIANGHNSPKKTIETSVKGASVLGNTSNKQMDGAAGISSLHSDAVKSPDSEGPKKPTCVSGTVKQASLKRVSFGSSKGSMVETLIYETANDELDDRIGIHGSGVSLSSSSSEGIRVPTSKLKVSLYESQKPLTIRPPHTPDQNMEQHVIEQQCRYEVSLVENPSSPVISTVQTAYMKQESTDSGWENPFRPGGDLSKEADEIVELIKEGKPITPTQGSASPKLPPGEDVAAEKKSAALSSTGKGAENVTAENKVNGNVVANNATDGAPVPGEVQITTAAVPADASQVEHVVLKKKRKCHCCVIQ